MVEACGDVYYSEPTDTMRGTRSYREGPPPRARAQERKLDIAVPSWPDIDARISAFLEMERQRRRFHDAQIAERKYCCRHARPFRLGLTRVVAVLPACPLAAL
jgi:hypothetical protein